MNKQELIKSIATASGVPQPVAIQVLNALQETVAGALQKGEKVALRGFGSFTVSDHAARRFYHPKTQQTMMARAYRTVRFVPSSQIKLSLN